VSKEELNKIMAIKKMDLEECELELNSRYQEQLEHYNELIKREGIA